MPSIVQEYISMTQDFFSDCPLSRLFSGGCTVTLVKREAVDELMSLLRQKFRRETSKDPDCFVTQACNGAGVLVPASQA